MANTLNLGTDGNWGTKEGSVLGYNSESNNFKPLPFDFTRAGSATRVNKEGLIEVVSNNEPRIDFLNDSKGALLLEPSRTNNFTDGNNVAETLGVGNATIIQDNNTSPTGTLSAAKFTENTSTNSHFARIGASITGQVTISIFAKADGRSRIYLTQDFNNGVIFNVNTGVVDSYKGSGFTGSIEDYGNGWYRCIIYTTIASVGTFYVATLLDGSDNASYTGDGVSSVLLYGAQLEQGSYATSYIPTQGSIGTRVAESSLQGGFQDKNIFGSTQGTALFEFVWDELNYIFNFNVGGVEVIRIFNDNYTEWRIRDTISSTWYYTGFTATKGQKTKIALRWSGTEIIAFQNGVKSTNVGTLGSNIAVESITQNNLNNTSNIQFYNTALTDQELINLTKI